MLIRFEDMKTISHTLAWEITFFVFVVVVDSRAMRRSTVGNVASWDTFSVFDIVFNYRQPNTEFSICDTITHTHTARERKRQRERDRARDICTQWILFNWETTQSKAHNIDCNKIDSNRYDPNRLAHFLLRFTKILCKISKIWNAAIIWPEMQRTRWQKGQWLFRIEKKKEEKKTTMNLDLACFTIHENSWSANKY